MKETNDLQSLIWELVNAPDYKPIKPRQVAKKLGLSNDDARLLKRTIKRMIKDRRLVWGPKHLLMKGQSSQPGPKSQDIVGVYKKAAAGYGFVRPEDRSRDSPEGS